MRHAFALPLSPQFVEHPLPAKATRQLRLALQMLPDDAPVLPEAIPLRAHGAVAARSGVLQPRLAWPERIERVRLPDGTPVERRADFYDWIGLRRRRAQMAARRALTGAGLD